MLMFEMSVPDGDQVRPENVEGDPFYSLQLLAVYKSP